MPVWKAHPRSWWAVGRLGLGWCQRPSLWCLLIAGWEYSVTGSISAAAGHEWVQARGWRRAGAPGHALRSEVSELFPGIGI